MLTLYVLGYVYCRVENVLGHVSMFHLMELHGLMDCTCCNTLKGRN